MKRIYILVEGQTEETFINKVLSQHYMAKSWFVTPIIIKTSPGHKGGVSTYGKIKQALNALPWGNPGIIVTTMFDLYRIPKDFPGKNTPAYNNCRKGVDKAEYLEAEFGKDIKQKGFIPNLLVHEFEALLFVDPARFSEWTDSPDAVSELVAISQKYPNPEDINEGESTAPSKRILRFMDDYSKPLHGASIASDIGLLKLRTTCPHFDKWLLQIETSATNAK